PCLGQLDAIGPDRRQIGVAEVEARERETCEVFGGELELTGSLGLVLVDEGREPPHEAGHEAPAASPRRQEVRVCARRAQDARLVCNRPPVELQDEREIRLVIEARLRREQSPAAATFLGRFRRNEDSGIGPAQIKPCGRHPVRDPGRRETRRELGGRGQGGRRAVKQLAVPGAAVRQERPPKAPLEVSLAGFVRDPGTGLRRKGPDRETYGLAERPGEGPLEAARAQRSVPGEDRGGGDRKSTRLNSSHVQNSYGRLC